VALHDAILCISTYAWETDVNHVTLQCK